jgi:hypothetical protein
MFPEQPPLRRLVLLALEKRIPMQFTILAKGNEEEEIPSKGIRTPGNRPRHGKISK